MSGVLQDKDVPPLKLKKALKDAREVTGAGFVAPFDLNGYLSEPKMKFAIFVEDDEGETEIVPFEIGGEQIDGFADAFVRAANDADALQEDE